MNKIHRSICLGIIILFFLPISYCSGNKSDPDSGQIILRVGDIVFMEDDYEVFFNKRNDRYQNKYKKPAPKDTIMVWQNEFITNAVLLAEAHTYGYQNDPEIERKVERVARTILFQNEGILYERCVAQKVRVTPEIRKQAMDRMNTNFELEYLRFISHWDMVETLGGDTVFSESGAFQAAVERCQSHPDIVHNQTPWNWLSMAFIDHREDIYKMEAGETSSPLHSTDGILIIHVHSKTTENKNAPAIRDIEQYLDNIVKRVEEQKLAGELDEQIFKKAKINIKEDVADKFWETIGSEKISEFDSTRFAKYAEKVIMSYENDSTIINVTIGDFINYYNSLVMRDVLSTKAVFYYYLREIGWEAHALKWADGLGLRQEKDFVIKRKLYKNRLVVDAFLRAKVGEISEDEIKVRYDRDIQRFNVGEYAKVSLLYFSSMVHAIKGAQFLETNRSAKLDSAALKQADLSGLVHAELGVELHYKSEKFNQEIMKQIFEQRDNSVGPPYALNESKFLVFRKEGRRGTRIKPYSDVSKWLREIVFYEKYVAIKAELASSLRDKYKIECRLDDFGSKK